jgi:hypothetical protein
MCMLLDKQSWHCGGFLAGVLPWTGETKCRSAGQTSWKDQTMSWQKLRRKPTIANKWSPRSRKRVVRWGHFGWWGCYQQVQGFKKPGASHTFTLVATKAQCVMQERLNAASSKSLSNRSNHSLPADCSDCSNHSHSSLPVASPSVCRFVSAACHFWTTRLMKRGWASADQGRNQHTSRLLKPSTVKEDRASLFD